MSFNSIYAVFEDEELPKHESTTSSRSFWDTDVLQFTAQEVTAYFEKALQLKPLASEADILKSVGAMCVTDLEALHGEAMDISNFGLDAGAQFEGSVWEVRIQNAAR
mmetsp:Transcript_70455/g.129081  ORF Transcript_70455/g.129081 Transcript_70455/m.129081 type:complete len:107 (+) Transcript_70455:78-398(+)